MEWYIYISGTFHIFYCLWIYLGILFFSKVFSVCFFLPSSTQVFFEEDQLCTYVTPVDSFHRSARFCCLFLFFFLNDLLIFVLDALVFYIHVYLCECVRLLGTTEVIDSCELSCGSGNWIWIFWMISQCYWPWSQLSNLFLFCFCFLSLFLLVHHSMYCFFHIFVFLLFSTRFNL